MSLVLDIHADIEMMCCLGVAPTYPEHVENIVKMGHILIISEFILWVHEG